MSSDKSPPHLEQVAALIAADDDDLLTVIGHGLVPGTAGFGSADDDFSRRIAERWIRDHLEEIRSTICLHPLAVRVLAEEDGQLKLAEVAMAFATALSASQGISEATAVALIVFLVRGGLPRFCGTKAKASQ